MFAAVQKFACRLYLGAQAFHAPDLLWQLALRHRCRCPVPEKWQKLSQTWVIIVQKKWNGNWCNFLVVTGAQKIQKTFWFHFFIKKIKHSILSVWEVLQKYSYKRRYIKKVMNLPTFNQSPIGPLPAPHPPTSFLAKLLTLPLPPQLEEFWGKSIPLLWLGHFPLC